MPLLRSLVFQFLLKMLVSFGIITLLVACGGGSGGGDSFSSNDEIPLELGLDGPGDIGNYFPLEVGNVWIFEGTTSSGDRDYQNTISINGTKIVNGQNTLVVEETNSYGEGSFESYLLKDLNGIANLGSSDLDAFGTQVANYWEGRFPLVAGESFVQLDRTGLDLGEDLDSDAINETFDIRSIVTVIGFTSRTVPLGTFDDVVLIQRDVTIDLILSSDLSVVSSRALEEAYFAAGIGWVDREVSISTGGVTERAREVLAAYVVDGQSAGINLVSDAIIDGQGDPEGNNVYYSFNVESDNNTTVAITGLTDNADLIPIYPGSCDVANNFRLGTNPEDCQVTTTANKLIVAVNALQSSKFTLSVASTPNITTPANEGVGLPVSITQNNLTVGQVRETSFYQASGLTLGNHVISISGLSDDADLHVFLDDNYSVELDCTLNAGFDDVNFPEDCTVPSTTEVFFTVTSGETSLGGASYIILVR